jgi:hypothetical protein
VKIHIWYLGPDWKIEPEYDMLAFVQAKTREEAIRSAEQMAKEKCDTPFRWEVISCSIEN